MNGPRSLLHLAVAVLLGSSAHAKPVPDGVWRLTTTDFAAPLDDLDPLGPMLEGAEVIGLGHAVHGSGGLDEVQFRLFRWLVERGGVRVLAIESPWVWAEQTGDYLRTCRGDPADATNGFFLAFRDTSTTILLQWMCDWNRDHADDPLSFLGFDTQQSADDARLLRRRMHDLGLDHEANWADVDGCVTHWRTPPDDAQHQTCVAALDQIDALLASPDLPANPAAWARIHARGLRANAATIYHGGTSTAGYDARDAGMADVLLARLALEHPGQRAAVIAHNGHLDATVDPPPRQWNWTTMGEHLQARLGPQWAAIAVTARHVVRLDVSHDDPVVGYLARSPAHVAAELRRYDASALLLDLDLGPFAPNTWRNIGAGAHSPTWIRPGSFRAVVVIDHARAALPPFLADPPPYDHLMFTGLNLDVYQRTRDAAAYLRTWSSWWARQGCTPVPAGLVTSAEDPLQTVCMTDGLLLTLSAEQMGRGTWVMAHQTLIPPEQHHLFGVGDRLYIRGTLLRLHNTTWLQVGDKRFSIVGDPWTSSWQLNEGVEVGLSCVLEAGDRLSGCHGDGLAYSADE